MKMRSPQMIGVEFPGAGSATFQRTFSSLLHLTGSPFSADTPRAVAPRQVGQLSALANAAQPRTARTQINCFMAASLRGWVLLVAVGPDRPVVVAVAGDLEEVGVQLRRVEAVPAQRQARPLRR